MSLPVIWLRLPDFSTRPLARPRRCPHCGCYILQRWGKIVKPVRDTHELQVEVHRYRCTECGRTFRAYPKGIDRGERTKRMRQMAALTWALGLSLQKVVHLFSSFGVQLSRTTIWRDGQILVTGLPEGDRRERAKFLGVGTNPLWVDKHQGGVILVIEVKQNTKVLFEIMNEEDPSVVRQWLFPIVNGLGLEMEVF